MNFLCIRSFNFYPHTNSHRLFKFIGSGIFMGPLKVLEGETFRLKSTSFINFLPLFHHRSSWTDIRNRFYVCHVSTTCVIYLIAQRLQKKEKNIFVRRKEKEKRKREKRKCWLVAIPVSTSLLQVMKSKLITLLR